MTILKSIVLSSSDEMDLDFIPTSINKKRQIYDKTRDLKRNNFKWSTNEILRLQREYELLEYDVFEIADLHQRSVSAIVFKLNSEKFIKNVAQARGLNITHEIELDSNDDKESNHTSDSEYIPQSETESDIEYDFQHNEFYSDYESDSDYDQNLYKKTNQKKVVIDITESDSDNDKPIIVQGNAENVSERVDKLETSVYNMEGMLNRLYNFITKSSSSLSMGYEK